MILTYIDESGTHAVPGNTSHYILAGLSIPISKWKSCEKAVSIIKSRFNLGDSEIHTGWMMRPYLEQEQIDNFESMDYATRAFNVKKLRNKELLRLQRPNTKKQYHKTKKNYKQTAKYIHLSYAERKQFIKEVADLIGSWSFARLFVDSQLTSMIQLADLCAYALRRYLENGDETMFGPIFSVADRKESRVVGVRHFSETTCSCKICEARRSL